MPSGCELTVDNINIIGVVFCFLSESIFLTFDCNFFFFFFLLLAVLHKELLQDKGTTSLCLLY